MSVIGIDRELPALKKFPSNTLTEQVITAVAHYYKINPQLSGEKVKEVFCEEKGSHLSLSQRLRQVGNPLVGAHFGITPQAVTNSLTEIEDKHAQLREVREEIDKIKFKS